MLNDDLVMVVVGVCWKLMEIGGCFFWFWEGGAGSHHGGDCQDSLSDLCVALCPHMVYLKWLLFPMLHVYVIYLQNRVIF